MLCVDVERGPLWHGQRGCLRGAGNFSDLVAERRRLETLALPLASQAVSKRAKTARLRWPPFRGLMR